MQTLRAIRSQGLLQGFRGHTAVDNESITACLQLLRQLVTESREIGELHINPLIVGQPGGSPLVADARLSLARRGASARQSPGVAHRRVACAVPGDLRCDTRALDAKGSAGPGSKRGRRPVARARLGTAGGLTARVGQEGADGSGETGG